MKKILSVFIIVAMMLTSVLAMIPVSAADPEGTAINNAAEFLAMTADGQYYLAKDITLTDTYAADFSGKLNGNGKTVTLKGEALGLFKNIVGGTVENLNIKASIETNYVQTFGLLAYKASGTFTNITVDANLKVVPANESDIFTNGAGLIVGEINGDATVTNCTTNGSIDIQTTNSTKNDDAGLLHAVGGQVGRVVKGVVTFKGCVNNAYVNTLQVAMPVGGIVGATAGGATINITFENCVNNGEVVVFGVPSGNGNAHTGGGGMIGNALGVHAAKSTFTFKNCRNNGYIHTNSECGRVSGVGGMIGRGYSPAKLDMENCVNAGKIEAHYSDWATPGGMIGTLMTWGFSWSGTHAGIITLKNCVNIGEVISHKTSAGGMIGTPAQFNVKDCQLTLENCVNYANVSGSCEDDGVGGILARTGTYGLSGLTIKNCVNYGDITNASGDAAGIVTETLKLEESFADGSVVPNPTLIENCVNFGKITAPEDKKASGIMCVVDTDDTTIKNCVSVGEAASPIMPTSKKTVTAEGNIFLGEGTDDYATAADKATVDAKAADIVATVPGNPAELDAVLDPVRDYSPVDYISGWEAFEAAREAAIVCAGKASSKADLDGVREALVAAIADLVVIEEVNIDEIVIALESAAEYEGLADKYTPDTWEVFVDALDKANQVLNDAESKQSTIHAATAALNMAIDSLAEKADFAALDAELAKYADYAESDYVSTTWAPFKAALDAADALKTNTNAINDDVVKAIAVISAAHEGLDKKANAEQIATLVAKSDDAKTKYPSDDYTAHSHQVLINVIRAVNTAAEAEEVGVKELEKISADIDAAVAQLIKKYDFTDLKALVESLTYEEKDYTEDSWAAYSEALEAAKDSMKPGTANNVSAEKGAEYKTALEAAIEGLVGWADYTELDAEVKDIKDNLKAENYTDESWAALKAAMNELDALKSNRDATSIMAEELLAKIKAARAALVEAAAPTEAPTDAPTTDGGDDSSDGGCGGFIATSVAVVCAVSVLGTAVLLKKKED
jgi:hypothetical protein